MDLHGIAQECHTIAQEHGFWEHLPPGTQPDAREISQKLMLVVSELGEAQEELRAGRLPDVIHFREPDGKPEGFSIELADAVIRILDLAMALDINIVGAISLKMEFNRTRPHKHNRQF